ncbi:MAG: Hsp20/alpha crystallin family protein [Chlamydiae bacterium]|nr:Hsp20/alpha crystallin family protein [Chlamydiota bacterium]
MGENKKIVPRSFWSFPRLRFPFSPFENEDDWDLQEFSSPSGLSVSEDDAHVYIEAAIPGIKPEEIEMTFDKGVLWIKAEKREETEDKKKKFYRKAMSTFSYRVAVPGDIEESKEPEATCKNGVIKITFLKAKKGPTKKIPIKPG